MIPADCRPATETETVMEILAGPDHLLRCEFVLYWHDDYLPPEGIRGQVFFADPAPYLARETVRVVDRRSPPEGKGSTC